MRIYISPSSQQANIGPNGYNEEEAMNLIADVLCPELTRHNIDWMRNNRSNTYKGHIAESDAYKPDYHLAIHSNATGRAVNTTVRGTTVYCYDPSKEWRPGTIFAQNIYNEVSALTPVPDRGLMSGRGVLSEVVYTDAPTALIEIDFHDNAEGAAWIMANIENIANALLMGILKTFGVAYIPKVNCQEYTVVSGDSLWRIASRLLGSGMRYTEIAVLNQMTPPYTLYAGMVLKVPLC